MGKCLAWTVVLEICHLIATCGEPVLRYVELVSRSGDLLLISGVAASVLITSCRHPQVSLARTQSFFVAAGIFPVLCTLLDRTTSPWGKSIICDTISVVLRGNASAKTTFKELNGYEFLRRSFVCYPEALKNSIFKILTDASIDYAIRDLDLLKKLIECFEHLNATQSISLVDSFLQLLERNGDNRYILSEAGLLPEIIEKIMDRDRDLDMTCLSLVERIAAVCVSAPDVARLLGLLKPVNANGGIHLRKCYDSALATIGRISKVCNREMCELSLPLTHEVGQHSVSMGTNLGYIYRLKGNGPREMVTPSVCGLDTRCLRPRFYIRGKFFCLSSSQNPNLVWKWYSKVEV